MIELWFVEITSEVPPGSPTVLGFEREQDAWAYFHATPHGAMEPVRGNFERQPIERLRFAPNLSFAVDPNLPPGVVEFRQRGKIIGSFKLE